MPPTTQPPVRLDSSALAIDDVLSVARHNRAVELTPDAQGRVRESRHALEECLSDGQPHYGINTGFGSLARQRIGDADLATLQRNLIVSHAAGIMEPFPDDVVRATMLLLAASLARGRSGVRVELVTQIVEMLNRGVTPIVPSVGSVGASGDLAPLAHIAQVALGEGRARVAGVELSGDEALARVGLSPIVLAAKEGLALINGTHLMAARTALLLADLDNVLDAALIATAMSIDAARATDAFLDPRLHEARNQQGQQRVASVLAALLKGSTIITSHRENDTRVQDPYSFRCAPQVVGAALDAITHARVIVERELGAVTDNPLVFDKDSILSGGNFHGMPMAIQLDCLAIALAHIAGIAERRLFWILSAFDKDAGLPPYLAPAGRAGVCSGLMIAQYTAAACVNELVGLANPASVANIPTGAEIEDYNSFGPRSAAKATRALDLVRHVVAIELMTGAEAIERHAPHTTSDALRRAIGVVRTHVDPWADDRSPAPDMSRLASAISRGEFAALQLTPSPL
ncbi:MAG: histidine ammonia-lyase [Phycisphaerales bacterium]|nr:MAG: histidine ammonia-lyase [Phycisphaerales bacterium]